MSSIDIIPDHRISYEWSLRRMLLFIGLYQFVAFVAGIVYNGFTYGGIITHFTLYQNWMADLFVMVALLLLGWNFEDYEQEKFTLQINSSFASLVGYIFLNGYLVYLYFRIFFSFPFSDIANFLIFPFIIGVSLFQGVDLALFVRYNRKYLKAKNTYKRILDTVGSLLFGVDLILLGFFFSGLLRGESFSIMNLSILDYLILGMTINLLAAFCFYKSSRVESRFRYSVDRTLFDSSLPVIEEFSEYQIIVVPLYLVSQL
ncbi:MAG: membrane protein of unknown function [Promethearchaeota archaeon]|nr:MAG: membrane protein of unknown function [Candidatus Lokiarchaeota archaeon]